MLKIAICDDEKQFTDLISEKVKQFFMIQSQPSDIFIFNSGSELLERCHGELYDLLLLDIDMPELSGFDVSAQLRQNNISTDIIFISGRENFVFQSIRYRPFRFIRKDRLNVELMESLHDFTEQFIKKNALCDFRCDDSDISVKINHIMYFESYNHDVFVIMRDNSKLRLNRKYNLRILENDFLKHGFIRIHKSYIVNYRCISLIKENDIILNNGTSLPSTKQRINIVKSQYRNFLMEEMK